ncbi:MAG: 2-oxoacid:acceptor oxidoreductase family protein [Deltaproteobacteria bacterium]|nr:2-oxoacid:acceptor oxidoreductase family protein [Deltaproteobacteria bacterium]
MERCRIVFSGSGGQGVITASFILAEAAVIFDGLEAVQSQSYGPEARGGSTRSDVIISEEKINFPKIIQPNILISLNQESYNKFAPIIRPGGILISDSHFVTTKRHIDAIQKNLPMFETVMENIKNPIVFNICMLGVLIELTEVVKKESVIKTLEKNIPKKFIDINKKALSLGINLAKE